MLSITINDVVISNYLDKYQVQINSVYDTETSFEAIDGTINQTFLGTRRTLQVDFEPMETTQINALYAAILASEDVSITYIDPEIGEHTTVFTCASLPAATYFEGEVAQGEYKQFWTIPTITFVEKDIDTEGSEGGGYDYKLIISGVEYLANEIAKNTKLSASISCDGWNVGQISSYCLSSAVKIKSAYIVPKRNDKVMFYVRTYNPLTETWGNWNCIITCFLKDFSLYGNGEYFKFTAYDSLSFLDNDYFPNYQRDSDGNIIPQSIHQHVIAVNDMVNDLINDNIYNGIVSNVSFSETCDNITINPQNSLSARTLIQNVAQSCGANYRQRLMSEQVYIDNYDIGHELSDEYIIYDSEREKLDYNFAGENIETIILYCGATTKLPCKIYADIDKDYDIYVHGTVPIAGYPESAKTLEVTTPYYGLTAPVGGVFNSYIGYNLGTEFSCSKIKMRNIIPIGSRVFFHDNNGDNEFDNTKIFFYVTNLDYTFTKSGVFASISGSSRKASNSYYLGNYERQIKNRLKIDATYNNVMIDNGGLKFAAPKEA